jgi:hypothetical protein
MNERASRLEDPSHRRLRVCRLLVKERQRVGIHIGFELCPVPAWDMLLDLYIAHHEGRSVQIWSLCVASNIPTSTAHRKIGEMVDAGILMRGQAGGRVMVSLSPAYREKIDGLFDDLATMIGPNVDFH